MVCVVVGGSGRRRSGRCCAFLCSTTPAACPPNPLREFLIIRPFHDHPVSTLCCSPCRTTKNLYVLRVVEGRQFQLVDVVSGKASKFWLPHASNDGPCQFAFVYHQPPHGKRVNR